MSDKRRVTEAETALEKARKLIDRQVDQINRLIGHEMDGGNPAIPRYEHELMTLNEKLAVSDIRIEHLEGVLRKIRKSCRDRLHLNQLGDKRVLQWIEEVLPDEGPHHMAEGRDTVGLAVVDQSTQPPLVQ